MLPKFYLTIFFVAMGFQLFAQAEYPLFKLTLSNGEKYTYTQIEKNKTLVLIYFAPDCEHCKTFMTQLKSNMGLFSNCQLLMVSYVLPEILAKFAVAFQFDQYSNVKIGSEGNSFYLPGFFKITQFPYIVVYNRMAKKTAVFKAVPAMQALAAAANK